MRTACENVRDMSKMIQIRNVPDELHRTLKARAARAGMSLSDYLLNEVRAAATRPTLEEFLERLKRRRPVTTKGPSSARIVRELRDRS